MKETAKLPGLLQPQVPIMQKAQLLYCGIKAWSHEPKAALQQGKEMRGGRFGGKVTSQLSHSEA